MGTSVSAILRVTTPAAGTAPGQAGNLAISAITSSSLTVSWTAPTTGTTPFTYQLQMKGPGQSSFSNVGLPVIQTSEPVTGLLSQSAYSFQVVTSNTTGNSTSGTVSATTLAVIPGAPTSLAVVGSPGQTSVQLTWVTPSTGTQPFTYTVSFRTPSGTGSFLPFATTTQSTTQTITGLTAGSTYDFIVTASNSAGSGASSTALTGVSTAGAPVAPSTPTGVTAVAASATSVNVSWNASATGTPPISYVVGYRVTPPVTVAPGAPTGLAGGTPTSSGVQLTWTAPTTGTLPFTYTILQSPHNAGTFVQIGTSSTQVFNVTGLSPSTAYDFEVTATNSAGVGPASNIVAVTTPAAAAAPGTVTALAAPSGSITSTTVTLTWVLPTTGGAIDAGGCQVQYRRGTTGTWLTGPFIPIVTPGVGSFNDASGNTWSITAAGVIQTDTHNGSGPQPDTVTHDVSLLCLMPDGSIWQLAASGWYSETAISSWNGPFTSTPFASPGAVVRNLTQGATYQFTVVCSNSSGNGAQATPISATTNTVTSSGTFTVVNGQVIDPNGAVFVARGIQVFDAQVQAISPTQIKNFFPRVNLIRLSVEGSNAQHGFQTPQFSWSSGTLQTWINQAVAAGLVVVLDDHEQSSGTGQYTGSALTADLAYATAAATTYKGNGWVWFQSMNEPGYFNGLSTYHQQFYNAVRGTGNTSIVLHDTTFGNISDQFGSSSYTDNFAPYQSMVNCGWDVHIYNQATKGNTNLSQVQSFINTNIAALQAGGNFASASGGTNNNVPAVFVLEYGFIDYNGNPYADAGGGDGTNTVVQAVLTTNVSNGGKSSGGALWVLDANDVFGWAPVTDLLGNNYSTITAHGQFWNANA